MVAAATSFTLRHEEDPVDALMREADRAYLAGDQETAKNRYETASERSTDPGRIAFNLGAIAFEEGNAREAEMHYLQAMEDRECPQARHVQALYNRAVCLIQRGPEMKNLRVAIQSLEACLQSPDLDERLRLDARHNLELAKLLWLQARSKEAEMKRPPREPEQSLPPPVIEPEIESTPLEIARAAPGQTPASVNLPRPGGQDSVNPSPSDRTAPGQGTLPVLRDDGQLQPLSREDTLLLLQGLESRLARDRQAGNQMRAGPERPRVRDW